MNCTVVTKMHNFPLQYSSGLEFNKSGFSKVLMTAANGNDIRLSLTGRVGKNHLEYSEKFEKWQLEFVVDDTNDLESWYADFQKYFERTYGIPVDFKNLTPGGVMYCQWARTFVNKVAKHDPLPVYQRGVRQMMEPEQLLAHQPFIDIAVDMVTPFSLVVEPVLWVRTETGKNTAGVTWRLKEIYIN